MKAVTDRIGVIQNIGWLDRTIRAVIGAGLMGVAFYELYAPGIGATATWHSYAVLIAVYPLMTSMLGWDPFYALSHTKSCDTSTANRCGTYPYELKAAFGHAPDVCELDSEHSLESCHDRGVKKPHHKFWKVSHGDWF